MPNVQELAAPVKLLLMDVDGVLTDGKLINVPDAAGNMVETKAFDSQDGIALQWLSWKGIKTGLISGRVSPATVERAKQCKFSYVYQATSRRFRSSMRSWPTRYSKKARWLTLAMT